MPPISAEGRHRPYFTVENAMCRGTAIIVIVGLAGCKIAFDTPHGWMNTVRSSGGGIHAHKPWGGDTDLGPHLFRDCLSWVSKTVVLDNGSRSARGRNNCSSDEMRSFRVDRTHKNCSYGRPEQVVLLGTSTRPLARKMHVITCRRWAIPIPVFGTFSPKQTWVAARRRRPFCLKSLGEGP
jgi:hypothetical protein